MKLGVSSYSFQKYMKATGATYFDICNTAKEIGFSAIEFIDLELEKGTGQQSIEELAKAIKAHCEKIDLAICAYTIGADFISGSAEDPEKETQRVKNCVDIGALLGVPVMRHDIAWQYTKKAKNYRDIIALSAPYVRQVAEYAKEKGIKTCTENHGYIMQDSYRVEEMILAVNHENFGWLVDIGNFACADEPSPQAVGVAAPYAFHVHAKDMLIKQGTAPSPGASFFPSRGGNHLRGTVVGHGAIPIRQCIEVIKKSGYDGFVSLEFEGMEETLPALKEGYAYLNSLI